MPCRKCLRDIHEKCETNCEACHGLQLQTMRSDEGSNIGTGDGQFSSEINEVELEDDEAFGLSEETKFGKLDDSLIDPQSTGRKRAARIYPLDKTAPCEWRGINQPGGSLFPLQDCVDGYQQARHHGPDYSTLNNDAGNVHRICHKHHNRFHALNDPFKDANYLAKYGHTVTKEALSASAKALKSEGGRNQ